MQNKIYNECCLATMTKMPEHYIDLVVTSPPYDHLRDYISEFDFKLIAQELYHILKLGGVIIWVVADSTQNGSETGTSFRQALYFKEIGFYLHDTMIYHKKNYTPLTHRRYEQAFEYMFCFSKGKPKTFNPIQIPCKNAGKPEKYGPQRRKTYGKNHAMRLRDNTTIATKSTKRHPNIFTYSIGKDKSGHPAPFPEQLALDQIITWSNENDLVYDPFMGSGTTAIAAQKSNRYFIGSEISNDYCILAENRLSQKNY